MALIGAGNLAWHLAPELERQHAVLVTEVYSRTQKNAKKITRLLYEAQAVTSLDFSESEAEIFVLAVSDDALSEVISELRLPEDALVIHTSGTKSLSVLERFERYGVFYPLQTFSQGKKVNFREIPFCLEASDTETLDILVELADYLTENIFHITSQERVKLHLAAVFACNFTNHLLAISSEILRKNHLEFDLLKPLIRETIEKGLRENPLEVQTGPAIRNDQMTLERHLEIIQNQPEFYQIYRAMTESIQTLK